MSEITNEMKAKCIGEFSFAVDEPCPACFLAQETGCLCGGSEDAIYSKQITVPWDTCKEIYKAMLACSPASAKLASQLAALKEENERLKAELAKGPRFEWPEPIVIYDAGDEPGNYYRPSQIAELLDRAGITDRVKKS